MAYQSSPASPVLSIGVMQRLTNLTPRQIRYYEQVGLLSPARTPGRHRIYSRLDVETLLLIRDLLNEGLSLDGVRALLDDQNQPRWADLVALLGARTNDFMARLDSARRYRQERRAHGRQETQQQAAP